MASATSSSSPAERLTTGAWRPGSAEGLAALEDRGALLALLTGNPEPAARARMDRLGLARFFPSGHGAFGCDGETRDALIVCARRRAGDWPADRIVEVGDTVRDVETAQAAGVRSVAFASGRMDRARLAEADAVVEAMEELLAVLERWGAEL